VVLGVADVIAVVAGIVVVVNVTAAAGPAAVVVVVGGVVVAVGVAAAVISTQLLSSLLTESRFSSASLRPLAPCRHCCRGRRGHCPFGQSSGTLCLWPSLAILTCSAGVSVHSFGRVELGTLTGATLLYGCACACMAGRPLLWRTHGRL
jgi:hypothetical protein